MADDLINTWLDSLTPAEVAAATDMLQEEYKQGNNRIKLLDGLEVESIEHDRAAEHEDFDCMEIDPPHLEAFPTLREATPMPISKTVGKCAVRFSDFAQHIESDRGAPKKIPVIRTRTSLSMDRKHSSKGEDRVLSWDKRDESHSSDRMRAAKVSTVVDETPSKGKPKLLFKQSPKNAADDDPMHSYMAGSRDVQLQAKEELNFIGNAYYYKLKKQANCEQLDGEYTVVYTRPVGKLFDPVREPKCVVFQPSGSRIIDVFTKVPRDASPSRAEFLNSRFASGNVALCDFMFYGTPIQFSFCLDRPEKYPTDVENGPYPHAHKTTFRIVSNIDERYKDWDSHRDCSEHPEYGKMPEIMKFLNRKLPLQGHTVGFGFKTLDDQKTKGIYGFHFMEIELACTDPATGNLARQLVVAVRMPAEGDVSSHLLLRQQFKTRHDLKIIRSDGDGNATYQCYDSWFNFDPNGNPQTSELNQRDGEDIGLIRLPFEFNPMFLERRLFLQREPLIDLGNIVRWLKEGLQSLEDFDPRRLDAHNYSISRLENLRNELTLRERATNGWASDDYGLLDEGVVAVEGAYVQQSGKSIGHDCSAQGGEIDSKGITEGSSTSDSESIAEVSMNMDAINGQPMQESPPNPAEDWREVYEEIDMKCAARVSSTDSSSPKADSEAVDRDWP